MSLPVSAGALDACAVVTPGFPRRRRSSCQSSQLPAATAAKIASGPRASARPSCRCSAGCRRLAGRCRGLVAASDAFARCSFSPGSCGSPADAASGRPRSTAGAAGSLVVAATAPSASDSGSIASVKSLDCDSSAGSSGRACGCTTLDGMGGMVVWNLRSAVDALRTSCRANKHYADSGFACSELWIAAPDIRAYNGAMRKVTRCTCNKNGSAANTQG